MSNGLKEKYGESHGLKEFIDPFFIVGNSRSGTTLMARILRSHSNIYVLKETFFYDDLWKERNDFTGLSSADIRESLIRMFTIQKVGYFRRKEKISCDDDVDNVMELLKNPISNDIAGFIRAFFYYQALKNNKTISGDQTPRHVFSIDGLSKMLPNSRYIHMVRDPRAVLLSQKNKWKATLRLSQPLFETIRTLINYHPITISLLWNSAIQAGLKSEMRLGQSRMMTIQFEDLVKDPEIIIRKVTNFLGVEYEKQMVNVSVEMSSNNPVSNKSGIDASIADVWKEKLSPTEVYLCEYISGKYLKYFNYKSEGRRPNVLVLLWYVLGWPIQMGLAFLLNITRIGNPITYITNRLFVK